MLYLNVDGTGDSHECAEVASGVFSRIGQTHGLSLGQVAQRLHMLTGDLVWWDRQTLVPAAWLDLLCGAVGEDYSDHAIIHRP